MPFRKPCAALLALCLFIVLALPAKAAAPGAGKKVRAAFVLLESIHDQGWSTSHYDGIEYLKKKLGGRVEVAYTENVHTPAEAERVFRDYARQGYDVIFGTTFTYMDAMYTVAGEFPKVVFMHCSGYKTRPNLGTYMVRIEQGEYLAGYLSGLMGYRNVGTVATQPIPEVVRGIDAFTLGLLRGLKESKTSFDADKVNSVVWLKSWRDAVHETGLAEELAAKKHDLIREMADTSESSRAACAKGVAAIGYGTDSAKYGAACALTSTTLQWGPLYVGIVKRILAGTWRNDQLFVGFEGGGVGLATFGKAV
ncbi:MAG: BMP family ABC transporter substrate-binding protein, partial [Humidesulfovibrio sp.]|nr:BMP family ABC transporter substrate-binding protein [Humidesulfovibrio sp.]